ncbi:MAG TPA: hypothetical protein VD866_01025 [Urbifossiella sp.]|nr:hypothetical protein [Urbifossiella sp.]
MSESYRPEPGRPLDRYGRAVETWLTPDGEPPDGDSGKPAVCGPYDADGNLTLAPPARRGR